MKIYHKKWRAMGTDCEIFVNSTVDPSDDIQRVITLIADYEQRFSRFLNQSELSILNYEKSLVVSPIFWEIMVISDKLFTFSNGIFNTLASSYHTGYVKSFIQAEPADFVKLEGREQNFDYQSIMKDEKTRKITLQSGQYLDFGGF